MNTPKSRGDLHVGSVVAFRNGIAWCIKEEYGNERIGLVHVKVEGGKAVEQGSAIQPSDYQEVANWLLSGKATLVLR